MATYDNNNVVRSRCFGVGSSRTLQYSVHEKQGSPSTAGTHLLKGHLHATARTIEDLERMMIRRLSLLLSRYVLLAAARISRGRNMCVRMYTLAHHKWQTNRAKGLSVFFLALKVNAVV